MTDPLLSLDAGLWRRGLDVLRHLILPALTLSLTSIAIMMRHQRAAMLAVFRLDYVSAARARGLPEGRVLWRHAWRNTLAPMITLLGLWLPILVSGSLFVEAIFSWPGLGSLPTTPLPPGIIPSSSDPACWCRAPLCWRGCWRTSATRSRTPGAPDMIGSLADLLRRAWAHPSGRSGVAILLIMALAAAVAPRFLDDPAAMPTWWRAPPRRPRRIPSAPTISIAMSSRAW
jgi:hypothetical protein